MLLAGLAGVLTAGTAHAQDPGTRTPSPYAFTAGGIPPTSAAGGAPGLNTRPSTPARQPFAADRGSPAAITRTAYQPPGGGRGGVTVEEGSRDFILPLEPPGLERLARIDSEESLQERIRQETREKFPNERIAFPASPILSRDAYNGRGPIWPHRQLIVEANYVVYGRLFFQQVNAERYGWDLGVLHPFLSTALFYKDLILLPYHAASEPCRCFESGAGYCLPGDPVPLMLYPEGLSATGAAAEAAVILALVAIFP